VLRSTSDPATSTGIITEAVERLDLGRPGSEMTTINRRTWLLIAGTLAIEMVAPQGWAASTAITVYKNPT